MGSRWREMLMDYGQILGDKSSRSSNSAFFTVDGDLDEKRNEELQLRRVLEVHFRPLFQKFVYGGEKMACHELRRILQDPEYRNRLPPDKVHELADLADFNMGRTVRYDEFVRIVMGRHDDSSSFGSQNGLSADSSHLGRSFGVVRTVCRNTTKQAMVDERLRKYKCLPPPIIMAAITIVQIVVFIVHSTESGINTYALHNTYSNTTNVSNFGCSKAMYHPARRHEAWRFVTYCFLHPGFMDLIFNVIIQIVLGIPLEIAFSTWRVIFVYFSGVIVGSLGQSFIDHNVGLTGAAGGSYAIVAAHLVALWANRKHLNDDHAESKTKRILCSIILRVIVIFMILIPQIVIACFRRWYYSDDYEGRIGIIAHLGGLFLGFTLGPAFLTDNKRRPWHAAYCVNFFFLIIFIGAAIIFNIVYTGYPSEDYS